MGEKKSDSVLGVWGEGGRGEGSRGKGVGGREW